MKRIDIILCVETSVNTIQFVSTLQTVAVKLVLFSYAFRLTNVDFFREFYNQILKKKKEKFTM